MTSLVTQVGYFAQRTFDKLVLKYQEGVRRFFLNQTLAMNSYLMTWHKKPLSEVYTQYCAF